METTDTELMQLYEAELSAFNRYVGETTGAQILPTDLEDRRLSPKRIDEAYEAWAEAHAALKAAGGTAVVIRRMLQAKHGGNGDPV